MENKKKIYSLNENFMIVYLLVHYFLVIKLETKSKKYVLIYFQLLANYVTYYRYNYSTLYYSGQ